MFIVLEGIDCTGKSTVTKILARMRGGAVYATPPKALAERREEIDRDATAEDHYAFYVHGNEIASAEINSLLATGQDVICDRYWLTTLVYHQAMGVSTQIRDFAMLRQPDHTFLLTVSRAVQSARFVERGMSAGDRRMLNQQSELADLYRTELPNIQGATHILDTDGLSPHDVAEAISLCLES